MKGCKHGEDFGEVNRASETGLRRSLHEHFVVLVKSTNKAARLLLKTSCTGRLVTVDAARFQTNQIAASDYNY